MISLLAVNRRNSRDPQQLVWCQLVGSAPPEDGRCGADTSLIIIIYWKGYWPDRKKVI